LTGEEFKVNRIDYTGNMDSGGAIRLNPSNYIQFYYNHIGIPAPGNLIQVFPRSNYLPGFLVASETTMTAIDVFGNGQHVGTYALNNSISSSTTRTLLMSITQVDSSGNITNLSSIKSVPPQTFTYQTKTAGWGSNLSTWNIPLDFVAEGGTEFDIFDLGVRLADVNGDGLVDLVQNIVSTRGGKTDTYQGVYLNTGSGWSNTKNGWMIPATGGSGFIYGTETTSTDQGARVIDLDGDGRADLVAGFNSANGTTSTPDITKLVNGNINSWLNNPDGTGWNLTGPVLPESMVYGNNSTQTYDAGTRLADVNGDGLPDVIWSAEGFTPRVWLATGSGNPSNWWTLSNWTVPEPFVIK